MTLTDALNELAAARQSRILSPYLGYRVRNAANDAARPVVAPLAHCPSCDMWIRENEGCLHMDPLNPRQPRATVARSGEITLPTGPGAFSILSHATGDTHVGQ